MFFSNRWKREGKHRRFQGIDRKSFRLLAGNFSSAFLVFCRFSRILFFIFKDKISAIGKLKLFLPSVGAETFLNSNKKKTRQGLCVYVSFFFLVRFNKSEFKLKSEINLPLHPFKFNETETESCKFKRQIYKTSS